jgi:gas vesicle protein
MAKSSSKIILAGLAGLAAGLVVGVLMAPGKGSKTRKKLKKKFMEMEEIFKESDLSDKLNNLLSIFTREKEGKGEPEETSTNNDQTNI